MSISNLMTHSAANNIIVNSIANQAYDITESISLTESNCGQVGFIISAASPVIISLPDPSGSDFRHTFVNTNSSLASSVTIRSTGANMYADIANSDPSHNVINGIPTSQITNIILGTGSRVCDRFDIFCSGSKYYVTGLVSNYLSVTFS